VLSRDAGISDIQIGEVYAGELFESNKARLSKNVIVYLENKMNEMKTYPIKIMKIKLPNIVEGRILEGSFEPVNEEKSGKLLVENDVMKKLFPRIQRAAAIIQEAINEGRQILIRHHFDCDGYSAALALEKAIMPLIKPTIRFALKKIPMIAPYYPYDDACKDLNNALSYASMMPLLILTDNGSTQQDLFSIKKLRFYGFKIIVIDHHFPGEINNGKNIIDEHVDVHVNPYLVGGDSNYTSGILASEVANVLRPSRDYCIYQVLSAITDKTEKEIYDKYALNVNLDFEFLDKMAVAIDFEASNLRTMETKCLMQDLFDIKNPNHKQLVELNYKYATELFEKRLKAMLAHSRIVKKDDKKLIFLDMDEVFGKSEYPPAGKSTGYLFKHFMAEKIIVAAYSRDLIIFRANVDKFNLQELMKRLEKKYPELNLDGGGHELAGTIKFPPSKREDMLSEIEKYAESL
jgi:RecJ-like exonuclease